MKYFILILVSPHYWKALPPEGSFSTSPNSSEICRERNYLTSRKLRNLQFSYFFAFFRINKCDNLKTTEIEQKVTSDNFTPFLIKSNRVYIYRYAIWGDNWHASWFRQIACPISTTTTLDSKWPLVLFFSLQKLRKLTKIS